VTTQLPPGGRLGDDDPPLPPPSVLSRFNARALDPADASVLPGQKLRPTAYVADRLLVRREALERHRQVLDDAAGRLGLRAGSACGSPRNARSRITAASASGPGGRSRPGCG
jgi:hypothetical protein